VARAERERRSLNTMLVIAIERGLSERGTTEASDGSEPGTPGHGSAERLSRPSTPRSESDTHFKPDPKPEKKGRR